MYCLPVGQRGSFVIDMSSVCKPHFNRIGMRRKLLPLCNTDNILFCLEERIFCIIDVTGFFDKAIYTQRRKEIIEQSLTNYGAMIVCRNIDEMVALANELAPEHLILSTLGIVSVP